MSRPDVRDPKEEEFPLYITIMDDISQMQTIASYCVQQNIKKYYHNLKHQAVCSACAQNIYSKQELTDISDRHVLYILPFLKIISAIFAKSNYLSYKTQTTALFIQPSLTYKLQLNLRINTLFTRKNFFISKPAVSDKDNSAKKKVKKFYKI